MWFAHAQIMQKAFKCQNASIEASIRVSNLIKKSLPNLWNLKKKPSPHYSLPLTITQRSVMLALFLQVCFNALTSRQFSMMQLMTLPWEGLSLYTFLWTWKLMKKERIEEKYIIIFYILNRNIFVLMYLNIFDFTIDITKHI